MSSSDHQSLFNLRPSLLQQYGMHSASAAPAAEVTPVRELLGHPAGKSGFGGNRPDADRFQICMVDSMRQRRLETGLWCFWCRHPFSSEPIGCPVRYTPPKLVKTCVSELTKETYKLSQAIERADVPRITGADREDESIRNPRGIYHTDGSFCSFACCQAFVRDNEHRWEYEHSAYLLRRMYRECAMDPQKPLESAPSWRLLRVFGGVLDIDEFRERTASDFRDTGFVLQALPTSKPVGHVFERVTKMS